MKRMLLTRLGGPNIEASRHLPKLRWSGFGCHERTAGGVRAFRMLSGMFWEDSLSQREGRLRMLWFSVLIFGMLLGLF